MPIQGKIYSSADIQSALEISKQAVYNLARRQNWTSPLSGLYWATDVEPYLIGRGIDYHQLPIKSYDYPEGATQQKMNDDFYKIMED